MDREALERSLARRLLNHIAQRTTDLADEVLELGVDIYCPEHHEREVEVLFLNRPLVFCLSGGLPGPGTYRTVDLCGTPILLTRDTAGRVHALANIRRHRGVRVADGAGSAKRFTCPFHAWAYDLQGHLVNVPTAQAFEGMCLADKGLVDLPVAEGHGLIVGRLRPGPEVTSTSISAPSWPGNSRCSTSQTGSRKAKRTSTASLRTGRSPWTPSGRTTTSTTCTGARWPSTRSAAC